VIKTPINEKEQIVTSLKVNPELWKQAKIAALECDITLGELIDRAIREYIEKQEKRKK
jgi:predicted HicB family RNase H-like nuclease